MVLPFFLSVCILLRRYHKNYIDLGVYIQDIESFWNYSYLIGCIEVCHREEALHCNACLALSTFTMDNALNVSIHRLYNSIAKEWLFLGRRRVNGSRLYEPASSLISAEAGFLGRLTFCFPFFSSWLAYLVHIFWDLYLGRNLLLVHQ